MAIKNKFWKSTKGPASKVDAQWEKHRFELNFTEALFLIVVFGAMVELSPFLIGSGLAGIELSILLPIFYFIFVTILFLKLRYRLKGDQTIAGFIFVMCMCAGPFSGLAMVKPELLSSMGIMDVPTSRKFSILFFLSIQILVIYSAVLLASTSWRIRILNKRGLDSRSLQNLHKSAILKNASTLNVTKLEEILYGIPSLRQLFINGEFGMTVAWGWSIIDRTLEAFTGTRDDRKGAKKIGFYNNEFEKCYKIRNSMVHDGHLPNHQDALSILKRVKALLHFLSKKHMK